MPIYWHPVKDRPSETRDPDLFIRIYDTMREVRDLRSTPQSILKRKGT